MSKAPQPRVASGCRVDSAGLEIVRPTKGAEEGLLPTEPRACPMLGEPSPLLLQGQQKAKFFLQVKL